MLIWAVADLALYSELRLPCLGHNMELTHRWRSFSGLHAIDTLHLSGKLCDLAIVKGKVLNRQSKNATGPACTNTKGAFVYELLQKKFNMVFQA